MKTVLVATAGLAAVLAVPLFAQGTAPAATKGCYIEVRSLMAAPPNGIADLGAAIRALDAALRPQVVEINALKTQLARLEQREEAPAQSGASIEAAFAEEPVSEQPAVALDSRSAEQVRRLRTDIDARQTKLKADYAAQQKALVGPVQEQINRRAQSFATSSGCGALKMARSADLAGLTTAGARNVTGEFVSWYATNKS